ncbi:D-2-hydroxyacid dehydrogenase family protein [Noviherbaspirillum sp. CPCC 100848]|uniref:D-2-hydroxyacid dehydrogenase family protein n=1 Tax=Noviherbaspirillum album TaxID=3080276 RepID=A0ABU6JAY6_9BURK|nr:D-2-hydroxyacid dehydrogenase family protein [Noviherbaspirillum sp. CPCC 100848]MEC4720603.1 D-2-hydroxyacid dehydrogenase family protein [Noviherbaspirillum sp. CPCC 100848]
MKIAILDDYQDCVRQLDCFRLLDGHDVKVFNNSARGLGQLAIRLAEVEALVLIRERTTVTRALLGKLPRLRLISQTGKVSGHVDVAAATERGVAIVEGVGDPTAPAELTWALIMASSRKIPQYAANLRDGLWQTASVAPELNTLGTVLKGRTLAIWGYGRIGRMVAGYGKAFGMKVLVWGRDASREAAERDGHQAAASREAFFEQADVLSLHLRLNDATRGIVSAGDLMRMKRSALFVNTSRAELVAEGALDAGLRAGTPGFAALDVFETEPLPSDSPLLRYANVLATPHLGYVEKDSYELYFGAAFQNIVDFAAGTPKNVLNPEALAATRT